MDIRYKVLIIDDEEPARALIREYLKAFPQLEVMAECADGMQGLKAVSSMTPDVIFLDIQMPRINGIEMLELLDEKCLPRVIFTTAYDEFAIKAFEMNAADYLLKPISHARFEQSVGKLINELNNRNNQYSQHIQQLVAQGIPGKQFIDRIVVNAGAGIEMVPDEEVDCLLANDDYVVVCTGQKEYLKKKTLNYYENHLDPGIFFRVHRSCIVNVACINRIEPYSKDSWLAILKNGRKIPVSKNGYAALRKAFDF